MRNLILQLIEQNKANKQSKDKKDKYDLKYMVKLYTHLVCKTVHD